MFLPDTNFMLNPDIYQHRIQLKDIITALAVLPRFCGRADTFITVAHHSLLVAAIATDAHRMEALLHDATEAYYADIPRPLKQLCKDYQKYERRLDVVIRGRYGLPMEPTKAVLEADQAALYVELNVVHGWSDKRIASIIGEKIMAHKVEAYEAYYTALDGGLLPPLVTQDTNVPPAVVEGYFTKALHPLLNTNAYAE